MPEYPGCYTQGETMDQLKDNTQCYIGAGYADQRTTERTEKPEILPACASHLRRRARPVIQGNLSVIIDQTATIRPVPSPSERRAEPGRAGDALCLSRRLVKQGNLDGHTARMLSTGRYRFPSPIGPTGTELGNSISFRARHPHP